MAQVEGFPDIAAADMVATDYFYIRSSANPAGQRDKRFAFSSIMRALFAAADKPTARVALGFLTAAANLNFPSIAAVSQADLTIAVPGAVVGDAVVLGMPAVPIAGLVFNAFVSATDTVTVRASNITAGGVDEASLTFRVVVIKST